MSSTQIKDFMLGQFKKNLVDASIGYKLSDGIKLDLSSTNLFNQKYRAFPNMPVIGRRVNLRAVFEL